MTVPLQTLNFMGTPIAVTEHNGQKWLTAEQIGHCLGYSPANARKGVLKVFERNRDEFSAEDTSVVTVTTESRGNRTLRVFSATGCNKLGFLTQTHRAKEFRAWASRVLAGQTQVTESEQSIQHLVSIAQTNSNTLGALSEHMQTMAQGVNLLLQNRETEAKYISLLEQQQRGYARINRHIEAQVLDLKLQGMPQAAIARELRISTSSVSKLITGKYTFTADAGEPHPEYPRLRAQVDELLLAQNTKKSVCLFGNVLQRSADNHDHASHQHTVKEQP